MHSVIQSSTLSTAQEAAILFAEGRESEVELLLARALTVGEGAQSRDIWLLALDLYRLRGNKLAFLRCAQALEQRFGGNAPPWDPTVEEERLVPEIRAGGPCFLALEGEVDAASAIALNKQGAIGNCGLVRLDATCLQALDRQACSVLNDMVNRLMLAETGLYITGAARLAHALRMVLAVDSQFRPAWGLLLRLWQLRNEEREYARVALEYSLAFGTQPPEWEALVMPVVAIPSVEEKRREPRYQMGPEVLRVTGTVSGPEDFHLRELQSFSLDRTYVNVDLSNLRRLDVAAAGALVDQANAMIAEGKVVRLLRQHGLILELLRALEIHPGVVCTPLTR